MPAKVVAFSGRKDKVALTRQWFSIQRPGQALIEHPDVEELVVLKAGLHNRKLKTGAHRSNRFIITLRGVMDDGWQARWQALLINGAANYFGDQRFGVANLEKASAWFRGEYRPRKSEQGMLLSAVRSQMFNEVLELRASKNMLSEVLVGDVCLLGDSRSGFVVTQADLDDAQQRFSQQSIHISAPLFGAAGGLQATGEVLALEEAVAARHPLWIQGLVERQVKAARRSTRLLVNHGHSEAVDGGQRFEFELPAGAFATALLAQVTTFEDVSRAKYSANQ